MKWLNQQKKLSKNSRFWNSKKYSTTKSGHYRNPTPPEITVVSYYRSLVQTCDRKFPFCFLFQKREFGQKHGYAPRFIESSPSGTTVAKVPSICQRSAGGNGLKLREEIIMLKAIYFMLALAALGVTFWQMGFLFGISSAPVKPDYPITLTAFTAAIVFFGLCLASIINREKSPDRITWRHRQIIRRSKPGWFISETKRIARLNFLKGKHIFSTETSAAHCHSAVPNWNFAHLQTSLSFPASHSHKNHAEPGKHYVPPGNFTRSDTRHTGCECNLQRTPVKKAADG